MVKMEKASSETHTRYLLSLNQSQNGKIVPAMAMTTQKPRNILQVFGLHCMPYQTIVLTLALINLCSRHEPFRYLFDLADFKS